MLLFILGMQTYCDQSSKADTFNTTIVDSCKEELETGKDLVAVIVWS